MSEAIVVEPLDAEHLYDADTALATAWWAWFAMLLVPFALFMAMIWHLSEGSSHPGSTTPPSPVWFIGTMIYMAIAVPAAFFWRSRLFAGYWKGQHVLPKDYLVGMLTIWASLEIGGVVALIGCMVTDTLLPNLLPALLAFMLFTPLWPNGHAMTRPLANEKDPGEYEDPR